VTAPAVTVTLEDAALEAVAAIVLRRLLHEPALLRRIAEEVASVAPRQDRQKWLSRQQAADYLGCSRATMDRLATSGRIPRQRINSRPKFDVEDLDGYLRDQR
jgi:excisionase family DNA binding protein